MIELQAHEFLQAIPLLTGIEQAVLPYAICQGINPGRVFVDRAENPRTALIWTMVGYYLLCGDPVQADDISSISQVLTETFIPASQALGERGFILVSSHEAWKDQLPVLLPGRKVIEIFRRPFAFDRNRFAALGDWRSRIPPGFRLQPVETALAEALGIRASWASIDDFIAHGVGFALLQDDEIASACTSVFASQTHLEIDVHTEEKYQRRGFAVLTACALIEACLQHGKNPNWECFWDNKASISLAGKLGFSTLPDFPVHYWEE